ncbi:hypothetical protein L195_g054051 [Trifolium pratense]|uniref:Uncharacterized protein n=1 Tax=Trifolium pratense TaxID=57577 RepID=A0A2K3KE27_TRIPR|nr:hypothetical protein L195_g054051 [Trifolium pratense]
MASTTNTAPEERWLDDGTAKWRHRQGGSRRWERHTRLQHRSTDPCFTN